MCSVVGIRTIMMTFRLLLLLLAVFFVCSIDGGFRPGGVRENIVGLKERLYSLHLQMPPKTEFQPPIFPDLPGYLKRHQLHPSDVDPSDVERKRALIFIGVVSASAHFAQRMVVRQTWLTHPLFSDGTAFSRFFVASPADPSIASFMRTESLLYRDMEILPHVDHYDHLINTTAALFTYGLDHIHAQYLMKVDDDTLLLIDRIVDFLQSDGRIVQLQSSQAIYAGSFKYHEQPQRNPSDKSYVSFLEYPHEQPYPPFAGGPGYILSSNLLPHVLEIMRQPTTPWLHLEDVSVGLWIDAIKQLNRINLQYVHDSRFVLVGCRPAGFMGHYMNPDLMRCIWQSYHPILGVDCSCSAQRHESGKSV